MKKAVKNAMAAAILNANMPIYTKTGDEGKTSIYGGKRVSKSSPLVEAYGSVDELTSLIGLVISKLKVKEEKTFLTGIQKNLYKIMSLLSGAPVKLNNLENEILGFEKRIDKLVNKLPKLNRFILPQGTELASWFHVLRTVCRRTERCVIAVFNSQNSITRNNQPVIIKYLNRLSDLFFMFARWYNKGLEIKT